ncbi:DUF3365 domain-containing protein [Luteolibacter sp. AS25]|uniref:Tll0287-like domain-containing protein n=1 Tax=Luteolibacter sp. AS25 TaxID=3135776 RepID=UPI00398B46BD
MKLKHTWLAIPALSVTSGIFASCSEENTSAESKGGYDAEMMAEAIYVVLKSDRKIYASKIVNRLVNEDQVIKASEEWKEDKALLLPAQMFREGAEEVDASDKPFEFSYSLQSTWPLNVENAKKKTPAVEEGLKAVSDPTSEFYGKKWTGSETLGGKEYFVGIYPDLAVAPACWECHNDHSNRQPDYPEFKKGDVMGGVVIRIPKS